MDLKFAEVPSPYYSCKKGTNYPLMNKKTHIVLHCMGEFIDTDNEDHYATEWLKYKKYSAHVMVTPTGTLIRCVPDNYVAWHARAYNSFSLGVEFLVPGLHNWNTFVKAIKHNYVSTEQLAAGVWLVNRWLKDYKISVDNVVTHQEIDPDRKNDPGPGFPLAKFKSKLI